MMRQSLSRRAFLSRAAGVVALNAVTEAPLQRPIKKKEKGRAGMIPIVDTHQHLWDRSRLRVPWLDGGGKLASNHVMSDYLREADGLNIVRTIYMEVDVAEGEFEKEAEYALDLCRRDDNPMVGAVIGGRPASEGFAAYMRRYKDEPLVKGVRQVLHGGTPRGFCLQEPFVRSVRLLGEYGKRFDLCLRSDELLDGAKLADLCPGTQFVLDHCGNANVQSPDLSQWRHDIAEVAKRRNVVCKISGIVASAKPDAWTADDLAPIVLHCAEVFGRDRIVFASDWPVCTLTATLGRWVGALQAVVHDWPETDRRKLFHDNAVRFYAL